MSSVTDGFVNWHSKLFIILKSRCERFFSQHDINHLRLHILMTERDLPCRVYCTFGSNASVENRPFYEQPSDLAGCLWYLRVELHLMYLYQLNHAELAIGVIFPPPVFS